MDNQTYDKYWHVAKPLMQQALTSIRDLLTRELPEGRYSVGEIYEAGDIERQLNVDVFTQKGLCGLSFEFVLTDGEENGADEGVGVLLRLVGYNALALGQYAPGAYTEGAFTLDEGEVTQRIEALDVSEAASHALTELRTNETLRREIASAEAEMD